MIEIILLFTIAIAPLVLATLIIALLQKVQNHIFDPCPRIYLGHSCHMRGSYDGCDHSNRAWAMLGIDKDELAEQPYKHKKKGLYSEDK